MFERLPQGSFPKIAVRRSEMMRKIKKTKQGCVGGPAHPCLEISPVADGFRTKAEQDTPPAAQISPLDRKDSRRASAWSENPFGPKILGEDQNEGSRLKRGTPAGFNVTAIPPWAELGKPMKTRLPGGLGGLTNPERSVTGSR
jgi:hypothetical protein